MHLNLSPPVRSRNAQGILRRLVVPALVMLGISGCLTARATTLNVPAQYATIQDAVNGANLGDTICVADGTYTGPKNRNINFSGKDLTVKSVNGAAKCVIDCQKMDRAFIFQSGETQNSQIIGLTIENGQTSNSSGGGIYVVGASNVTVRDCTFTKNIATTNGGGFGGDGFGGGGMYGGTAINCIFTSNTANGAVGGSGGGMIYGSATNCAFATNIATNKGGGVYNTTVTGCTFTSNTAINGGGAYNSTAKGCTFTSNTTSASGGGMYAGTATECTFTSNKAATTGGGMTAIVGFGGGSSSAVSCTFTSNSASSAAGIEGGKAQNCTFVLNTTTGTGGVGGGMDACVAINCLLCSNISSGNGGGANNSSLYFCTVFNNTAKGASGGGLYNTGSNSVTNCIVWGNKATTSGFNISNNGNTLAVTCSDVQGGYVGTGNINADPQFVNASTSSYDCHLMAVSPCINVGTTTVPSGFTFPATDLDGNPRTVGSAPDMGAYEYGGAPAPTLVSVTLSPSFVIGGTQNSTGTITLSAPAPTGGATVMLSSGDTTTATVPASVVFSAGSATATFPVTTAAISVTKSAIITANYNNGSVTASLTVTPPPGNVHYLIWENNISNDVIYWQMNLTQYVNFGFIAQGVAVSWKIVGYADVTGDGSPDLIWQNSVTNDVLYWQLNGTQYINFGYLAQGVPTPWKIVAVADITGDGKPDLIWQNSVSGDVLYWQMNGTQYVNSGYLAHGASLAWKIVGCADVTGDGLNDLIWENKTTNDVIYWQMNGTQYANSGYLAQGVASAWKVVAVGDLTGDGKPDLIWQNSVSGDVLYWQMNGTAFSGTYGYLAQGLSAWRVAGLQ